MTYIRNSIRRARGERGPFLNPRAAGRLVEAPTNGALSEIRAITQPVLARAAERGTKPGGTIAKIARIVENAIS
jgi:hypothetical protein